MAEEKTCRIYVDPSSIGSQLCQIRCRIDDLAEAGKRYAIKRVIVNKPAVIVYWADGTKTVVKKQKGDKWDPEKGVAMAICKRLYGNTGRYNDVIKRALGGGNDGR